MNVSRIEMHDLPDDSRAVLMYLSWRPARTEHSIARARRLSTHRVRDAIRLLERTGLVADHRGRYVVSKTGRELLERHRQHEALLSRDAHESRKQGAVLLSDSLVHHAISAIVQRAERTVDQEQLAATFVDPGLTEQLHNPNHQIVYGRRGTGKTHVLQMLHRHASRWPETVATYIDVRQLASTGSYEDESRPVSVRVTNLLKAVLAEIQHDLLDVATDPQLESPGLSLEALDDLAAAMSVTNMVDVDMNVEHEHDNAERRENHAGIRFTPMPSIQISGDTIDARTNRRKVVASGRAHSHIKFQDIAHALQDALRACGIKEYTLLLDEWSALPLEVQPWLADCLRGALTVIPEVTVKIAALEYRSRFSVHVGHNEVRGLELGAELSSSLQLDNYFVFDHNPASIETLFAEMLYRHIAVELETKRHWGIYDHDERDGVRAGFPWSVDEAQKGHGGDSDDYGSHIRSAYLAEIYKINNATELVSELFATKLAFRELVRAAEGVARDFMAIFAAAFFTGVRQGRKKIDVRAIRKAAHQAFGDKMDNVDDMQRAALEYLANRVLGERCARAFLVEKPRGERDGIVRSLFDFRLLHLVNRDFFEPTQPMITYDIYTLDYGLYAPLLDTAGAPSGDFTSALRGEDGCVAIDDKRWVRRIIIDTQEMCTWAAREVQRRNA
jgi:hypothetical protein